MSSSHCFQELYGWTMDAIVKQIGLKNNCKFFVFVKKNECIVYCDQLWKPAY